MNQINGRSLDALRPIKLTPHFTKWAEGSVLTQFRDTHVLCNVTLKKTVPQCLNHKVIMTATGHLID